MTHRRGPAGEIRPGLSLSGNAAKKVVHQRVNNVVCQRLVRKQHLVVAGAPQLVHHRLGVPGRRRSPPVVLSADRSVRSAQREQFSVTEIDWLVTTSTSARR